MKRFLRTLVRAVAIASASILLVAAQAPPIAAGPGQDPGAALPELAAALPPVPARPAPSPARGPAEASGRGAWRLLFDGVPAQADVSPPAAGEPPAVPLGPVAAWLNRPPGAIAEATLALPSVGGPAAAERRVPADRLARALGLDLAIDPARRTVDLRGGPSPAAAQREIGAAWSTYADLDGDGGLELLAYTPSDGRSAQWVSLLLRAGDGWRPVSRSALPASYVEPAVIELLPAPPGWRVHVRSGERHALYYWDAWLRRLERIRWEAFGPGVDEQPPPPPPERGDLIRIDRARNRLYLYRDGRLARAFPVATGRGGLTPVGRFTVLVKVINPDWKDPHGRIVPGNTPRNPLGSRWLGLSAGPEPGSTYGIHGTNEPFSVGAPASSGCVRLINPDAEELFDLVPAGTPVEIY